MFAACRVEAPGLTSLWRCPRLGRLVWSLALDDELLKALSGPAPSTANPFTIKREPGLRRTGSRRHTNYEALMAIPLNPYGGFKKDMSLTNGTFKLVTLPHWNQTVSRERHKVMANQRKCIGALDTIASVIVEHK